MADKENIQIKMPSFGKEVLYWVAIITLIVMLVGTGLQNDKVTRYNRNIVADLNDCLQNNTIIVPCQCPNQLDIDWNNILKESG